MLEILGQSQNPAIIQLHLKKLFSGIHKVRFSEQQDQLLAMLSSLGESVPLLNTIEITEIVEQWLEALSKNMVTTLKSELRAI